MPVRATAASALKLRRARLPTASSGARSRLLGDPGMELFIEEIPREGVHLERLFRCARGSDGTTYLWLSRRRSIGKGEGRSGLAFDYLE